MARHPDTKHSPDPLSGPRKMQRDEAIRRAVESARHSSEEHVVWMDNRGVYHVSSVSDFPRHRGRQIAIAYPNGSVAYGRASESRRSPRSMNAGHHIAPGYPAERFRIGQDVAMISNPMTMGHVVGFDPDGSVMVQWHGGRAVSGVDARNLRGLPPGYAGRRASEARRSSSARPLPGRHRSREGSAPSKRNIDEMFDAYVETALWSSTAEDDTPLDRLDAEVADSALDKMRRDVESFARDNAELIERADVSTHKYGRWGRAGHDFWLTRNGHGAGFWDGDWEPEEVATALSDAARAYGEVYLYVGDDGMIYSD